MGLEPGCSRTRPSTARFVSLYSLSRSCKMGTCFWLGLSPVAKKQIISALPLKSVSLTNCPRPIFNEKEGAGIAVRASFVAPNARLSSTITNNNTTIPTANEIVRRLGPIFGLAFIFWVFKTSLITPTERTVPTTLLLNSSPVRKRTFPPSQPATASSPQPFQVQLIPRKVVSAAPKPPLNPRPGGLVFQNDPFCKPALQTIEVFAD